MVFTVSLVSWIWTLLSRSSSMSSACVQSALSVFAPADSIYYQAVLKLVQLVLGLVSVVVKADLLPLLCDILNLLGELLSCILDVVVPLLDVAVSVVVHLVVGLIDKALLQIIIDLKAAVLIQVLGL